MGTTGSIFTGSSQFSADFQNVITRAVQIASLPMTQMTSNKTDLSNQGAALSGLDSVFKSLQTSVNAIQSSMEIGSMQATVSDSTKATATLGDGAMAGIYSVKIGDPGTFASSTTNAQDYSGTHEFKLSLNGVAYGLTVADGTAAGVAAAINTQFSDQVQATVVNVGTVTTPDYRISLRALRLGDVDPQVLDGTDSLSDPAARIQGVSASYTVNNSSATSTSDSRTLSIADGVTVSLQAGATGSVDITVAPASSTMTTALANFATAYNAAANALSAQRGQAGGALAGDPILGQLSQVLRNVATYSDGSGSVTSLAALGLDLGSDGHITFNQFNFAALNTANATGVSAFLGSATTGGFLQTATDALNMVEQADTGLLPIAETSIQSSFTNLTSQITEQQTRVDRLQTQLQQQMSAADALIASMEQQYSYISNMFAAMQTASQQYK